MTQVKQKKQYFDLCRKDGYLIVELDGNQVHFEVQANMSEKLHSASPVLTIDANGDEVQYQHEPHHNNLIMSAFVELVNQSYWQRTQSQPVQSPKPYLNAVIDKAKYQAWLSNDWENNMRNEAAMWRGA